MFHPLAHNIFDSLKLEPVNYYLNNGSENNNYPPYHPPYGAYITPEVTITYDTSEESKEIPKPKIENISDLAEERVPSTTIPETNINEKKSKTQTCKICNKTLASASSYYVHMKQHSDSKPFSCSRCDATFCRKPYLEVHMRVHTGERPYECDVCKKRFTQKSSLNTHKKGHSGLRPYVCQICMKTFTVKSYLTAHQWTHISDSGVTCNECEVSFTNKQLYLQHMQTHNKKEFECTECKKAFAKESYLIRCKKKECRLKVVLNKDFTKRIKKEQQSKQTEKEKRNLNLTCLYQENFLNLKGVSLDGHIILVVELEI